MMTKPYGYPDDIDDGSDYKTDSYTVAGAAPGASVLCSLFLVPCAFVPVSRSGFCDSFLFLRSGSFVPGSPHIFSAETNI